MSADPPASDATAEGVDELSRPAWQPRFYEPGDAEAVVRMLSRAFPKWPRMEVTCSPAEHLRWKLSSHPEAGPLSIVTEHESSVVGWQGYWLQKVKLGDQELLSRHAVDFAVHPDYQRMGIKIAMREKAQINNPRRKFALHFEPRSGHPAFEHMRQKNPPRAPGLLANRVEARVLRIGIAELHQDETSWQVRAVPAFDRRVDALWDAASPEFRLAVVRRVDYLNWRYADPRPGRYTINVAEVADEVLGYIVSRFSFGRGFIADVLALPGRIDVVRSLVSHALSDLHSLGAAEVECWLPEHHPYWEALNHYSFDHKRRSIDYRLAPAREYEDRLEIPFVDDPKAPVHITMGDSDLG